MPTSRRAYTSTPSSTIFIHHMRYGELNYKFYFKSYYSYIVFLDNLLLDIN